LLREPVGALSYNGWGFSKKEVWQNHARAGGGAKNGRSPSTAGGRRRKGRRVFARGTRKEKKGGIRPNSVGSSKEGKEEAGDWPGLNGRANENFKVGEASRHRGGKKGGWH